MLLDFHNDNLFHGLNHGFLLLFFYPNSQEQHESNMNLLRQAYVRSVQTGGRFGEVCQYHGG
ncbi:hypothetical protein ES705_44524 [subsurface metagenome]